MAPFSSWAFVKFADNGLFLTYVRSLIFPLSENYESIRNFPKAKLAGVDSVCCGFDWTGSLFCSVHYFCPHHSLEPWWRRLFIERISICHRQIPSFRSGYFNQQSAACLFNPRLLNPVVNLIIIDTVRASILQAWIKLINL